MMWQNFKLDEVCTRTSQRDPSLRPNEQFTYVDISSVDKDAKTIVRPARLLGSEAPSRARKEIAAGDILVSTVRPNLNAVAEVPKELDGQIASTGFCVLRPKPGVAVSRYCFYWAQTSTFINYLVSRARGASYPAVTDGTVLSCPLPLPPLREQRRIVEILDQAAALRRERAEADTKVDGIPRSLFVKLFGDPVTNSRGWAVRQLGDSEIGVLDRGRSQHRPRNAPHLYGGPYPFVQTGDVANSGGVIRCYSQSYSEAGLAQSRLWPAGTLCITIAANIAKTGILTFDACFPDSVVGFVPGKAVTTEYVQTWLTFVERRLEELAPQMAQKNINLEMLRNLQIPVPPIEAQREYSRWASVIQEVRTQGLESQAKLTSLFDALMNRAFDGSLTARWREANMKELLAEMEQEHRLLNPTATEHFTLT